MNVYEVTKLRIGEFDYKPETVVLVGMKAVRKHCGCPLEYNERTGNFSGAARGGYTYVVQKIKGTSEKKSKKAKII